MKVGKFLIDDIDMSEFNFRPFIGHINVKSHYNAFKHDIMFTYYRDRLYKFPDGYTAKGGYTIDLDGFVLDSNGDKINIDTTSESTESNYLKATELLPKYKIIYTLPSEYDSSEYTLDEDGYITTLDGERVTPLLKGIVSGSEWETFSDLIENNET